MTRKVYLLGVDHCIQHRHPNTMTDEKVKTLEEFFKYVNDQVQELSITILAEEFSQEACKKNLVDSSVIQEFSSELGTKHIFCDPDSTERIRCNIVDDTEGREEFWTERLIENSSSEENIFFVVGFSHIRSIFEKINKLQGFCCVILREKWEE